MSEASIAGISPRLFSTRASEKSRVKRRSYGTFAHMGDLTFEEARENLAISKGHLHALVSRDLIPYYRVGRLIRFEPGKLADWKAGGGTAVHPAAADRGAGAGTSGHWPEVGSSAAWRKAS